MLFLINKKKIGSKKKESALCCSCLEPLFSLSSQTACTQCTFSTLPGVIVRGTGSQPSYTASSEQAPIHFTAENSMSGTMGIGEYSRCAGTAPGTRCAAQDSQN
jgi:hypothetical protein